MNVSLGDVSLAVRRAVWGSGTPFGVAEDTGRAAAALARSGIDPLPALLRSIDAIDQGSSGAVRVEAIDGGWRLRPRRSNMHASAIYAAPSACDFLRSPPPGRVEVASIDEPLLLVAAATLASENHGCCVWVTECGDGAVWRVSCEAGVAHLLAGSVASLGGPQSVRMGTQQLSDNPRPTKAPAKDFSVEPATWLRVCELGSHALVPATAASRAHGAGAGLVDTD